MNKYLNILVALLILNFVAFKMTTGQKTDAATHVLSVSQQDVNSSRYVLSARQFAGTISCGPGQQITNGWQLDTEHFWTRPSGTSINKASTTGGYFSNGTFTAPISGTYAISAFMRNQYSDMDVTIRKNGMRKAAFGTNLVDKVLDSWMSTGTAINMYLDQGDILTLWYESGQSNDCSLETSFYYTHFNAMLIFATDTF